MKIGVAAVAVGVLAAVPAAGAFTTGPTPISGTKKVKSFTLGRGQTDLVTGDLVIVATRDITIAGTLLVKPGVKLRLHAGGMLTITGQVTPAPATARELAGLRSVRRAEEVQTYEGGSIRDDGNVRAPANTSVHIAVKPTGSITLGGVITTGDGLDAENRDEPGGDAGDIILNAYFGNAAGRAAYSAPARAVVDSTTSSGRSTGRPIPAETGAAAATASR